MDYLVVSTSKCKYQEWQIRLMIWSIKKVNQKGKLLLLVSEDISHQNEGTDFDFGSDAIVINLPDYAHQWKEQEGEWWGGIPNKFESFYWLAANHYFKPDDVLLFLDPDMLFVECVELSPDEDEILGQTWKGYKSISGWDKYDQAFMYPFCLRANSLRKFKEDFKDYCIKVRKQENRWESDMWALDYAAKDNGLQISYLDDLGWCTVWRPNDERKHSAIIHYPNVIKNKEGEKIFFKQDYTFDPNQSIKISSARNKTDELLLSAVTQERTDYRYHLKWDFPDLFKFYTGTAGYVYIKPWPGGFNNIRMSLELGICIAYLTNRTVILPPAYKMYLLEGVSDFSNYFSMDDLGVKHLTFSSFCNLMGISEDEKEVQATSKIIDYDVVGNVLNFEKILPPKAFTKGRKIINRSELLTDEKVLFFSGNLLGNFYQTIYTAYDTELKKLVGRYVVYRNEIFDTAWRFINELEDQSYYAIHIRRNDFQYKELFISCEEILLNIKEIVPIYTRLYIATDHNDKSFFDPLKEYYQLTFYDDILDHVKIDSIDNNWIPIIEQLICTRAIKFIGMKLSTLSSLVFRMRGYMDDIEDKNYYINTVKYNPAHQIDFIKDTSFIANWSREYRDAWDFQKPAIFVSIAAYCDTQLIPTITNLLENAGSTSRIYIGVHLQDNELNYRELLSYDFPNLKIIFTPKDESKGVVWARNEIKRRLYNNEEFFLQIDSHSRFKQNWDNILINQFKSIERPKKVISTYPNHFEISDEQKEYLELAFNSPLKIKKFLSENDTDNRLRPENKISLKDYEVVESRWCAAGFTFAPSSWLKEVVIPDEIKFNGEEDMMTFLTYLQGYDIMLPSEAVVWHNYNYKNEITGERYKEFNSNKISDDSVRIVNNALFNRQYQRTVEDLESFLNINFKDVKIDASIFVSICCYLDHDVRSTILSCIEKAHNARRIKFGICLQHDHGRTIDSNLLDDLKDRLNIDVVTFPIQASRGPSWARKQSFQLFKNENFFLQVDSHTLFIKDWDKIIIDNYNKLIRKSRKPIISYRPPYYHSWPSNSQIEFQFLEDSDKINIVKPISVSDDYLLEIKDFNVQNVDFNSILVPLLSSSFIFSEGRWIMEIDQDPNLYYVEEELVLSLRSFTYGYDIFTPSQIISWHKKNQVSGRKHYETHPLQNIHSIAELSSNQLRKIIEGESMDYGLGNERTLQEFKAIFGIDFKNKAITKTDYHLLPSEK